MKKVLLINPWAVNNDAFYTGGMIKALHSKVELDVATNFYYEGPEGKNTYRFFFPKSEYLNKGIKRKITRTIEYLYAYFKIFKLVSSNKYDNIHIHWLLLYPVDHFFLKKLKKHCKQLILTAHNVIPHVNGESKLRELSPIYTEVDTILVHGEAIKSELVKFFPETNTKVKIQRHGVYLQNDINFKINMIPDDIRKRIESASRKYIMFGNQFYNKGTDRLIKIWREKYINKEDHLLIIAGKRTSAFPEFYDEVQQLPENNNILLLNQYVDSMILNYLITCSDAILLPYRHASMSGVIFTAAAFSKPVLCTECGALNEYLENEVDSIVIPNTDANIEEGLLQIEAMSTNELDQMGNKLAENIKQKYSWEQITTILEKDIYC